MGKLSWLKGKGNSQGAPTAALEDSLHDLSGIDHLSEREASSSWFRSGVAITDVYDVVEVLGQGTMGEVVTVRRKVTGHHTDLTREKLVENERELSQLRLEEEAKERARAERRGARRTVRGAAHKAKKELKRATSIGGGREALAAPQDEPQDEPQNERSYSAPVVGGGGPSRPKKERSNSVTSDGGDRPASELDMLSMSARVARRRSMPFTDLDPLSASVGGGRRGTVRGAAHKAKKELKRKTNRGSQGRAACADEDCNLAPFIDREDDDRLPPQRLPTCAETGTLDAPPKSILKDTSSADGLSDLHSTLHSDSSSDGRRGARNSPGKHAVKAVHFQRTFAVKTILTSHVHKDQMQELMNEIRIMRKLDHPYVLKLYEVYQVKRKLWLVTELLQGGDLTSRKLNEHDTKNVIEQVLRALVYLHRMGVVHRDIKLENVLYENHSQRATVRLIDFGLSRTFDMAVAADSTRTPYTLSPETAESMAAGGGAKLTDKTDVWAVGVIAFVMLSGEFPFIKTNAELKDQDKMETLKKAKYRFGITWKGRGISEKAKEFVKGCLERDPGKRWTARQALENVHNSWAPAVDKVWDKWQAGLKKCGKTDRFIAPQDLPQEEEDENGDSKGQNSNSGRLAEDEEEETPLLQFDAQARAKNIKAHVQKVIREKNAEGPIKLNENAKINLDEIERYTKCGLMKKTILFTMANTMDRGELVKLRELFLEADTKDTGTITQEELLQIFRTVSSDIDEKRVVELFEGMDRDQSGHIHYAEFLAALAESHGLVTLDRLSEAFDRIDAEGKGYINHGDLKGILGKDYDKEMVDKMIEEGDFKKNNQIDYEELLQLMFSPVEGGDLAGSISPGTCFAGD